MTRRPQPGKEPKKGRRARRWAVGLVVMFGVWLASVWAGTALENQFVLAVRAAAQTGGWEVESVRMRRGSYVALPFVFWTNAEIVAQTAAGERLAEVDVMSVPLLGFHRVARFSSSD